MEYKRKCGVFSKSEPAMIEYGSTYEFQNCDATLVGKFNRIEKLKVDVKIQLVHREDFELKGKSCEEWEKVNIYRSYSIIGNPIESFIGFSDISVDVAGDTIHDTVYCSDNGRMLISML